MKAIGIDIGTTKSCIGYEEACNINIIPNVQGEETVPSFVSVIDNKIVAGIDAYNNRISNSENTVSEIKRIIGKNFYKDNLGYQHYKKNLSYELIEEEEKPILIKIKEEQYSPEEIYAYLIKKVIENGRKKNIITRKAVITIPACFGISKRKLIKDAAKLAGINVSQLKIIYESSAAIIAFEIYINKLAKKFNFEYNYDIFSSINDNNQLNQDEECSPVSFINNLNKLTIIFDLGGGKFDLTLYSIEEEDNILKFNMKDSLGDPNLGGIDFDNKLVEYCINDFSKKSKIKADIIYQNKKAIQRLKIKCEIGKKILSEKENVIINVYNFIDEEDLSCTITRKIFDEICDDLYKKIINQINKLLEINNLSEKDINELLLIGGSSKIPKIKQILIDKFTNKKVIYNLNSDKIIVYGAVLYASEMKRNKSSIILNEIIPFSLGIGIINNDAKSFYKYGDKMNKIIKKNTNLHEYTQKQFKININKKKVIDLTFYEGESKYVKYNQKLGNIQLEIPGAEVGSIINFDLIFHLDANYNLKIRINVPTFEKTKEVEYGNYDKSKNLKHKLHIKEIKFDFSKINNELFEYSGKIEIFENEDKNSALINCCKCCDEILDEYNKNYYKEDVMENIYNYTKKLFYYYLLRLTIKNKKINDNEDIILKIKEKMNNLIENFEYMENLLFIFKDLYIEDKYLFFEIFKNYIELIHSEGKNILLKKKNTGKYYSKIFFENCAFILKNFLNDKNLPGIKEELSHYLMIQKSTNETIKEFMNSRKSTNKSIKMKSLQNIIYSLNI